MLPHGSFGSHKRSHLPQKSPYRRALLLAAAVFFFLPVISARAQIIDTIAGNITGIDSRDARQIPLVITRAVAVDPTGTFLYIGDDGGRAVRRIDLSNGTSTIVAGGGTAIDDLFSLPGRAVSLVSPVALAVDGGGAVYIVDDTNHRVRRLSLDGKITTVAGNGVFGYSGDGGPATRAQLFLPGSIALDKIGNIYIGDRGSGTVRKVDRFTGIITTIAGDPDAGDIGDNLPAKDVFFKNIGAVSIDQQGNVLISDNDYQLLYRLDVLTGKVRLLAGEFDLPGTYGDGGPATDALLENPQGLAVAANGDIYIGLLGRVRKISASTGIISTVVGNGAFVLGEGRDGRAVSLSSGVSQLAFTPQADRLFIATGGDHVVGELNLNTNIFSIVAGSTSAIGDQGPAISAALGQPDKLALDRAGNLYVADFFHHRIRKIEPGATGVGTGIISTVAGNGIRTSALHNGPALQSSIAFPRGITVAPNGDIIFTDSFRYIRRLDAFGNLSTIAGQSFMGYAGDNGPAAAAKLNDPYAVISDHVGNLYVADTANHRVRKISVDGTITTIAGTGVAGDAGEEGESGRAMQLERPTDLFLTADKILFIVDSGNRRVLALFVDSDAIYVATTLRGDVGGITMDSQFRLYIGGLNRILRGDFSTLTLDTIAGDGRAGFSGDGGLATLARTSFIAGMVVDSNDNLIFTDNVSNRIRRITSTPVVPSLSAGPPLLTFRTTQGGVAPAEQNLSISASNLASANWTATVQALDGQGWLSLGATRGTTPALVPVAVDASRLAPGSYAGRITLSAPGAANSPITISVNLVVGPAQLPKLDIGPRQLSFRAVQGSTQALTQSVAVNNDGGGLLNYSSSVTTSAGGSWLSVTPGNGNGPALVTIAASPRGLAAGSYRGEVRVTNTSSNLSRPDVQMVTVNLVVEPARPVLQLSHNNLIFTSGEQSSFVPSQSMTIVNSGNGSANWTAQVTPLSGGQWLSLSAVSGTARPGTPSRISVAASPVVSGQNLTAGVYDSLVTITAPGAANSPQIFLARFRVEGAASAPIPTVQPGGLVFSASAGADRILVSSVVLSSSGGTAVTFDAAARTDNGGSWLALNANSSDPLLRAPAVAGRLSSSADANQIFAFVTTRGLAPGTYFGRIAFSFNSAGAAVGSTAEVGVLLVIAPAPAAIRAGVAARADSSLPPHAVCNSEQLVPQITSITNNLQLPTGWPASVRAFVLDNCGGAVPRASVVATVIPPAAEGAAASAEYLALQPLGDGAYTANYNLTQSGNYQIFVTASGGGLRAGSSEAIVAASTGTGRGSLQAPAVNRDGVVSGASFRSFANLAPGEIVSVFGSNLGGVPSSALNTPLPTELAGVSVILGGQRMPLYFSGSGQLNAQVPFELPVGNDLPVLVTLGGKASPPETVSLARSSPGLFTTDQSGQGSGVITNAAGQPISASNPARRGDVVIVYGTGLGATTPAVPTGSVSPSNPPAQATLPVRASVGGASAAVEFAGLTPGFVGLYQVNLRIPDNAPAGPAVELTIEQDGNISSPVTLAVQ